MTERHAASSTIDALMYSLRSGTPALARSDVQQRLAALSEGQLHDICKQLQNRNPAVAASWNSADVEKLIVMWVSRHG